MGYLVPMPTFYSARRPGGPVSSSSCGAAGCSCSPTVWSGLPGDCRSLHERDPPEQLLPPHPSPPPPSQQQQQHWHSPPPQEVVSPAAAGMWFQTDGVRIRQQRRVTDPAVYSTAPFKAAVNRGDGFERRLIRVATFPKPATMMAGTASSIGSAGSVGSAGSAGSVGSVGSAGSAGSVRSAGSAGSAGSAKTKKRQQTRTGGGGGGGGKRGGSAKGSARGGRSAGRGGAGTALGGGKQHHHHQQQHPVGYGQATPVHGHSQVYQQPQAIAWPMWADGSFGARGTGGGGGGHGEGPAGGQGGGVRGGGGGGGAGVPVPGGAAAVGGPKATLLPDGSLLINDGSKQYKIGSGPLLEALKNRRGAGGGLLSWLLGGVSGGVLGILLLAILFAMIVTSFILCIMGSTRDR